MVRCQQATIDVLLAQLGQNASNSSIPPSANPRHAPKPVVKKKSKCKPGSQPGHAPRLKQLLPPEQSCCAWCRQLVYLHQGQQPQRQKVRLPRAVLTTIFALHSGSLSDRGHAAGAEAADETTASLAFPSGAVPAA